MLLFRLLIVCFFFFKQKTAYEMRISDWSSDVCSSDLHHAVDLAGQADEEAELGDVLDLALQLGADRVVAEERLPRVGAALLEAQADATLLLVDVEDHHLDFLRGGDDLARVDVLLGPAHL